MQGQAVSALSVLVTNIHMFQAYLRFLYCLDRKASNSWITANDKLENITMKFDDNCVVYFNVLNKTMDKV
jgi:hypothetical protein